MLGGGVGVGLYKIGDLGTVSGDSNPTFKVWCSPDHKNVHEVNPDPYHGTDADVIDDSREGWVEALRKVLLCAWQGKDLFIDVSRIRPRGAAIKTFGGIACGPGPLVEMLRNVWRVVRGAAGRKISSVEALDITNLIGKCIKSGNVRRSALIVLGDPNDQAFRDAKKDFDAVVSHRHTSNNSIVFRSFDEIDKFDWNGFVQDNVQFGEPGFLNLALARMSDPGANGVNPCGEQVLWDKESCNLAEVFPANFDGSIDDELAFRLVTRYCVRTRLTPLSDQESEAVAKKNMRIGVGLGGLCDFDWSEKMLSRWYKAVRNEANKYAEELGVSKPITTTTVKPSGTISLLCGSSPGIHAPFAPYYIRRVRISRQEPMSEALKQAGVPWEYDKYDQSGNTLCFMFPMKAKHNRVSVQTETVRDQFMRQLTVQRYWADNAVSTTISFDANKPGELVEFLEDYAKEMKSASFLAKSHGYEQPPYEAISRSEFVDMASKINYAHPLTIGAGVEIEECSNGACPIR